MKEKNLCLNCEFAVWIRGIADVGKLPKEKREEYYKQVDKVKQNHGVDIKLFPFIWCPKWKKEQLYPYENTTMACKYYKEQSK